ncbi:MAG: UvrD/REP helicase [Paenibacillus sp.]|nr:UvrD/REP helicase [Paenibacillus sp.]
MFEICLSPEAQREISAKRADKNLIQKRIERLQAGHWDGGTYVKTLKGVERKGMILEARVDDSKRMLFTLQPLEKDGQTRTALYIFHLAVSHDRVMRTARTLLDRPITLEEYNRIPDEQLELSELAEQSKPAWPEQRLFHSYISNLKFYQLDDEDWCRFFNTPDDEHEEMEFKLKLVEEQREAAAEPLPLLLSGTAGSGKTTISIYKLLEQPHLKKLYITYTEELCEGAAKQFRKLVRGHDEEDALVKHTVFTTFGRLIRDYHPDTYATTMSFEKFRHMYELYAERRGYLKAFHPAQVYEEIRSVWKSEQFSDEGENLSAKAYAALTEDQAPAFSGNRKTAYALFEWYEEQLRAGHIADEQDQLRRAKQAIRQSGLVYDLVVCDEVQDLSYLHITLVFLLAGHDPNRLVFTGDDHQIVHFSGFRWSTLQQALYTKLNTPVKLYKLSRNFRSAGTIVKLANAVNAIQDRWTDFQFRTKSSTADLHIDGDKPVLLQGRFDDVLLGKLAEAGTTLAILVRDEQARQELTAKFHKKHNKSPLIFTVKQSKGLEYSTIVLWNLVSSTGEPYANWEKAIRLKTRQPKRKLAKEQEYFVRDDASLLYVAITRAMKRCIVYEGGEPSSFWQLPEVAEALQLSGEPLAALAHVVTASTAQEWLEQGEALMKKEMYEHALQCFQRVAANDPLSPQAKAQANICQAYLYRAEGDLASAAELFKQAGKIDVSAKCYDDAGMYREASQLYRYTKYGAKDYDLENKYLVKLFDQAGEYRKSANLSSARGRFHEAGVRFERDGDIRSAADNYERGGHFAQAIELYSRLDDIPRIHRCIKQLHHPKGEALPKAYRQNGKIGFRDKESQPLIDPLFDEIGAWSERMLPVRIGAKWGAVSADGIYAVEAQFDEIGLFSDHYAEASKGGERGYVDRSGSFLMHAKTYKDTLPFAESYGRVKTKGKWHFISISGRLSVEGFAELSALCCGLAAAKKGRYYGYVDAKGAWMTPAMYEYASPFHPDGYAIVGAGKKRGLLTSKGQSAIPIEYELLTHMGDGHVVYGEKGLFGYLRCNGTALTPAMFTAAQPFCQGYAYVETKDRCGYLDKTGKLYML